MKYHAIFLYFLRMNQYIDSLHCRGINLKGDLIKNLLKDFINLREFSLSFADTSQKKREIGSLIQAIMTQWKQIEFLQLENFQFNIASYGENHLYNRLAQSQIRHLIINDLYIYSTKLYQNPLKLPEKKPMFRS